MPISRSTGATSRTTNGSETKIVASTIPGTLKITRMPASASSSPNQPVAPVEQDQREADDDRRDRERQVDERLEQPPCRGTRPRTSTSAVMTPKIVFSGTAIAVTSDRQVEGVHARRAS